MVVLNIIPNLYRNFTITPVKEQCMRIYVNIILMKCSKSVCETEDQTTKHQTS
jgi:hypothetical protein